MIKVLNINSRKLGIKNFPKKTNEFLSGALSCIEKTERGEKFLSAVENEIKQGDIQKRIRAELPITNKPKIAAYDDDLDDFLDIDSSPSKYTKSMHHLNKTLTDQAHLIKFQEELKKGNYESAASHQLSAIGLKTNTAKNVMGGAAAGFAVGGPAGAVVGGVIAGVVSLVGKKARGKLVKALADTMRGH